jgi:hypothetical protein
MGATVRSKVEVRIAVGSLRVFIMHADPRFVSFIQPADERRNGYET